jgi:methionine sulfoxide reductase heme-binding subunit
MSHGYKMVQWNPFKVRFDRVLLVGLGAFLTAYVVAGYVLAPAHARPSEIQLLIGAFGTSAFALLTAILLIGPLARLSARFAPLLYNRRHLGVACFGLASVHAALVVLWYHGFSEIHPLVSLLTSNPRYNSINGFPFESLGLIALIILALMAATSHDFWNAVLGPRLWKAIHMSVYAAFALIVGHVMLGAVQGEKGLVYACAVTAGAALVTALHIVAARIETRKEAAAAQAVPDGWLRVGEAQAIPDGRALIFVPQDGERIAVFREGDKIYAVANACRHQGGPLGEGRIVDGCIVCPWHGFQYQPQDGCSPAPYTEKIPTYDTRIDAGIVFVNPKPHPPGTPAQSAIMSRAVTT